MIFVLTLAFLMAPSWGLPTDLVIQFERSVSINGTVVERISVNGADSYLKGQSAKHLVRSIQDDALRMIVEHATASNATYIRLRECKYRGYQVFGLSDRFQMNGKDYLALDPDAVSWTVLVPEARDMKKIWTLETELASLEKSHLIEDCEEFIKQMNDGNQDEIGVLRVIAPVFTTIVFVGFVFTSILIFKRHGQHPGGVIGSIIHYPAHHHLEVPFAGQSQKSSSNTGTETKQQVPPVLKGLFQQT